MSLPCHALYDHLSISFWKALCRFLFLFVCVDIQKSGTYKESGNAEFFLETQMPVGKLHNTGTEKMNIYEESHQLSH